MERTDPKLISAKANVDRLEAHLSYLKAETYKPNRFETSRDWEKYQDKRIASCATEVAQAKRKLLALEATVTPPPSGPIAEAVEPLKEKAIERAVEYATKKIEKLAEALEKADWDLHTVAPYVGNDRAKVEYYKWAGRLVVAREGAKNTGRLNDPYYVQMNPEEIAAQLRTVRDMAAHEFRCYVRKLEEKTGAVEAAELTYVNGLWFESILRVRKADGSEENWRTQIITNYSKYGLAFNQFPTRKMGGGK